MKNQTIEEKWKALTTAFGGFKPVDGFEFDFEHGILQDISALVFDKSAFVFGYCP